MFTVKNFSDKGTRFVYACDHYHVTPPNQPVAAGDPSPYYWIHLFNKPDGDLPNASHQNIAVDNVAYIENANGHTVDVIRHHEVV